MGKHGTAEDQEVLAAALQRWRAEWCSRTLKSSSGFVSARASVLCFMLSFCSLVHGQRYKDFTVRTPLKEGDLLIIGFMGGRESWDNHKRGVRKLALKLRAMNLPGVYVETVENKKRRQAMELIRKAFDRNCDGQLDVRERASARVVIYGQSFGGAAVVKLARQLKKIDVPVLLTVQVDSVGRGDKVIPANVARAANLFQRDGFFIKGEREIRPEDPSQTTIIGNFKFAYSGKRIYLSEVSWLKRLFQAAHTKMDHDPEVWALVEKIILDTRSIPKRYSSAGSSDVDSHQLIRPEYETQLQTSPKTSSDSVSVANPFHPSTTLPVPRRVRRNTIRAAIADRNPFQSSGMRYAVESSANASRVRSLIWDRTHRA